MTTVCIRSIPSDAGGRIYQASAGDYHGNGTTPGAALDAIASQLSEPNAGLLVVLQGSEPDIYFPAEQRDRLVRLMSAWRDARDHGGQLSAAEQAELESLIQAEICAAGERAKAMADSLKFAV